MDEEDIGCGGLMAKHPDESVVVHATVPHEQYRDTLRRTKVMAVLTHVLAAAPRARNLGHGLTS